MKGLRLIDMGENRTVRTQQGRGGQIRNPFDSAAFRAENKITLDVTNMFDAPGPGSVSREDVESLIPEVIKAHQMLKNNEGDICDHDIPMTGWQDLPVEIGEAHLTRIRSITDELAREVDAFVSLGIGGSYLGIEATFRALTHTYFNQLTRDERGGAPEIYFLGQNMDPDFFRDTLDMLQGKRIAINVISKSGTTTETAIAFRVIRKLMEENWGEDADRMILVTTDRARGALKEMAGQRGYRTFVIPDNIGGRFSVLTDVGLVGLAMANIDIREFVAGFIAMRDLTTGDVFWENPSLVHAAMRHAAWCSGKKIEVVATNAVSLYSVARWMEQLFPESEGHDGHGLWVSPSLYSEKLHANGQMVQQGERNILETFLLLKEHDNRIQIPRTDNNLDGLDFIVDKGLDMNSVNRMVIEGPAYAHHKGGVPNMTIEIPRRNAFNLGQLYYMMERSVAISGYLLGHNPFIQPGVEAYKEAMFALIGKPGFEEAARNIRGELEKIRRIRI
ncbi:MAG: glucose-6-phosphate isomerase [Proteobacteria bacterium]|nr:glucose-6-phosphate isomerase [Pseudomonadota bacterium]MBU1904236.1 glucose-6-phosphate isomerase [Pseudomonadota bacterium]